MIKKVNGDGIFNESWCLIYFCEVVVKVWSLILSLNKGVWWSKLEVLLLRSFRLFYGQVNFSRSSCLFYDRGDFWRSVGLFYDQEALFKILIGLLFMINPKHFLRSDDFLTTVLSTFYFLLAHFFLIVPFLITFV